MKPGHVFTIEPMICEGKSLKPSQDFWICHESFILTLDSKSKLSAVVKHAEYISEKGAGVMVHCHSTRLLSLASLHTKCSPLAGCVCCGRNRSTQPVQATWAPPEIFRNVKVGNLLHCKSRFHCLQSHSPLSSFSFYYAHTLRHAFGTNIITTNLRRH